MDDKSKLTPPKWDVILSADTPSRVIGFEFTVIIAEGDHMGRLEAVDVNKHGIKREDPRCADGVFFQSFAEAEEHRQRLLHLIDRYINNRMDLERGEPN